MHLYDGSKSFESAIHITHRYLQDITINPWEPILLLITCINMWCRLSVQVRLAFSLSLRTHSSPLITWQRIPSDAALLGAVW